MVNKLTNNQVAYEFDKWRRSPGSLMESYACFRGGLITGLDARQPEIDALKARVAELERKLEAHHE